MLVSIIVPCRDGAPLVGRLIGELRRLRPPPGWAYEIIVGYQRSTDGTLEVLRDLDVTVVHSDDFGPGPARNAAARAAAGEVLWFIDVDAYPATPDILVNLSRHLPGLGSFGSLGGPILIPPEQRANPVALADHFACWFNWSSARRSGPTRLFQPGTSLFMSRTAFERVGGFDPALRVMQDFEIQHRVQQLGFPSYFLADLPVYHQARETLRKSWAHSWWWGAPFRQAYLDRVEHRYWWMLYDERWFWLNLPVLYLRRLGFVLWQSARVSLPLALYSSPFLAATVFAWALAVVAAPGQPRPERPNP